MRRPLRDPGHSQGQLTRRALVVGGLQLGFAGILAARMRYMQVEQADEFRLLA